ncbi:hypothetical protein [uncultured Tenacibaculum sp.]|uniref:hypothetical protein n=1 Tax=uncultured Tenacibaculum sp. TaxID=174713 RepID=UPI002623F02A|nr:hypothetical protein [uncultured Tenacibaculum sp.]
MKKLFKITLYIFFIILGFTLFDLYAFRGYYTNICISKIYNYDFEIEGKETNELTLKIINEKKLYNIHFKNKTAKPFFVWTYRNDEVAFKVNDSVFRYQYRLNLDIPEFKNKYEYGLDCGTGAGSFSINPYESFTSKIPHEKLLDPYYWGTYHQKNNNGDTINDLIYNKPLLLVYYRKNTFKVFNRTDITDKDSIYAQLYLPVFSYNRKDLSYIKSNYINLSYKDIVNRMIQENSRVFKQVYN